MRRGRQEERADDNDERPRSGCRSDPLLHLRPVAGCLELLSRLGNARTRNERARGLQVGEVLDEPLEVDFLVVVLSAARQFA